MMWAVLEFTDFAIIAALIAILAGGAAASSYRRASDRGRLERMERKLDLILSHLGIAYIPPAKSAWQEIADEPGRKIAAIKAYREQNGGGLLEAKKAVEDYIEGR